MAKNKHNILLIILILAFFLGVFFFQKNVATEKIATITESLNIPERYSFSIGKNKKEIIVLDTYTTKTFKINNLNSLPEIFKIPKNGSYIAYSEKNSDSINLINLKNHNRVELLLDYNISDFSVSLDGLSIAVKANDRINLISLKNKNIWNNGERIKIDSIFKVHSFEGALNTDVEFLLDNLFFIKRSMGKIFKVDLETGRKETILDLGEKISLPSISPDSSKIYLLTKKSLLSYELFSKKINTVINIKKNILLDNRPYISNNMESIVFLSKNESNIYIQIYKDNNTLNNVKVEANNNNDDYNLSIGWLNRVVILTSYNKLYLININNTKDKEVISFDDKILTSVILSDSKTLLLTLKNALISIIDINKKETLNSIKLPFDNVSNTVVAKSNSLCH